VPREAEVQVVVPVGTRSGDVVFATTSKGNYMMEVRLPPTKGTPLPLVPGTQTAAEPFGYAAAPADVFACGVVLFILATGLPPWREARSSDGHFAYAYTKGIPMLLKAWSRQLPAAEQELLVSMLRWDPSKRPTAEACLAHKWFTPLHGTSVPTHRAVPASPPASPMVETDGKDLAAGSAQPDDLARLIQGLTAGGTGADAGGDAYRCSGVEGEWADLVSHTGCSADYYGRPEVSRGEAGTEEAAEYAGSQILAGGDFYGSLAEDALEGADVPEVDPAIREPPMPLGLPRQLGLARHGAGSRPATPPLSSRTERFDDNVAPPEVPDVEGFRFEPTTMHVSGSTPADVGNHLLAFLMTVAGAEVTKVNCRKFTMKATVQGDAGFCTLKVRIYGEGEGRHAVEFQRRAGDVMAIHILYQRAVDYLEHLVRALTPEDTRRPCSAGSDRSEVDAAPLDDWADPGVRGLLKRNRRRHLVAPEPGRGGAGRRRPPAGVCGSYGQHLLLAR